MLLATFLIFSAVIVSFIGGLLVGFKMGIDCVN